MRKKPEQVSIGGLEDVQKRHPDDFYITPAWVVRAILPHLKQPRTVLDIGCGTGAIGRVLRQAWIMARIGGVDADLGRSHGALYSGVYDLVVQENWLSPTEPDQAYRHHAFSHKHISVHGGADLIISNPPFRLALRFLELALERVKPGGEVAFLLPAQWDQETNECPEGRKRERGRFLDRLQRDGREGYGKYAVEGRVDFKGTGSTDRVTYAWFVFGPGHEGVYRRVPMYAAESVTQLRIGGV
jgi:SAM-dependent methyltransferase